MAWWVRMLVGGRSKKARMSAGGVETVDGGWALDLPLWTTEKALGMSRSEFFATAAQRYLDELDAKTLTGQIDAALATLGSAADASAGDAVAAGRRVLGALDDQW